MPSATPHDRHRAACSAGYRQPRAQLGPWAARGPRRSCTALYEAAPPAVGSTGTIGRALAAGATRRRMHISAPPAARPARGPWAAGGPEELRDSEWSHGCRRDAVTQYLVPQLMRTQRSFLNWLCSIQNRALNCVPEVLKQTARKLVSLVTTQIVCESRPHVLVRAC